MINAMFFTNMVFQLIVFTINELRLAIQPRWKEHLINFNDADKMLNNAKDSFELTLESKRKTPDFFQ